METVNTVAELRTVVGDCRSRGKSIGFVPTMGNLHAGHMALVKAAREQTDFVVVSIFVNPLQFGRGEDLASYPRTPQEDAAMLRAAGVELLFTPNGEQVYPRPPEAQTMVTVPALADDLCGRARPGHFAGVATVVAKLFNMVVPDVAFFGEKDLQQLVIVRRMVEDLNWPIGIVGVPTVREADGLALSSRNSYLTPEERLRAPALAGTLGEVAEQIRAGNRDFPRLEEAAEHGLEKAGWRPEYVRVRTADDLAEPGADDRCLVVLGAARLGKARLIDNVPV